MPRRPLRHRMVCLVAALAASAGAAAPGVRGVDVAAAQDRCDGVWVVVDATRAGGDVTTRCAAGDPASGLAALSGADHTYEFVPQIPGMVCTIDRRPDPCNGAPSDAYWSYWHAEAGGSWNYSQRGAGNRDPQPGEVEGWAFGSGQRPGRPPPPPAPRETEAPGTPSPAPRDGGAAPTSGDRADAERSASSGSSSEQRRGGGEPTAGTGDRDTGTSGGSGGDEGNPGSTDDARQDGEERTVSDGEADTSSAVGGASLDVAAGVREQLSSARQHREAEDDPVAEEEVAVASSSGGDGSRLGGTLVGAVLVAALAVAGGLRARRRDEGGSPR